jgi:hypothetical protein
VPNLCCGSDLVILVAKESRQLMIEHPEDGRLTRQRLRWRNISLVVFVASAFAVAAFYPFPADPPRPYLVALGWAIWFKLLLEFVLGLPMRWLYVNLWPNQRSERSRVIWGSGAALAALTIFIFRG